MTFSIGYANVNNVSIKTQIKKLEQYEVNHRSGFERAGALALIALIVFSTTELSRDANKLRSRVESFAQTNFIAHPVDPAEKNETVRMPIKFDDGLRASETTGA